MAREEEQTEEKNHVYTILCEMQKCIIVLKEHAQHLKCRIIIKARTAIFLRRMLCGKY
jgi:hypothetical protein